MVLSLTGGLAGVALGWAGTRVLAAMQPEGMIPVREVGMSPVAKSIALDSESVRRPLRL
jgi:hypothetical protein